MELRFLKAFDIWKPDEPQWFFGIEEASVVLDMRGIDFIAWVKYANRRETMPVPIQVKSSDRYVKEYYEKHSHAESGNIVMIVVPPNATLGTMRRMAFERLRVVRDKKITYYDLLFRVGSKPVNSKGQRFLKKIEEKRARREQKLRPTGTAAPTPLWHRPLVLAAPPLSNLERFWYELLARIRIFREQHSAPH
jgi:hypothetical protein